MSAPEATTVHDGGMPGLGDVADLVGRCVQGDDSAKAEFINEYGPVVRRAVARKLGTFSDLPPLRLDVEDLCGDIFARLLADDCRPLAALNNPRCIYAWLVAVSRNHVVDCIRKRSTRMRTHVAMVQETEEAYAASPAEEAMARESAGRVRAEVAALEPEDRLVIELFYLQGLRYAEIAELTSQNINTVGARIRRAKAKLRASLESAGVYSRGGVDDGAGK